MQLKKKYMVKCILKAAKIYLRDPKIKQKFFEVFSTIPKYHKILFWFICVIPKLNRIIDN